MMGDLPVQPVLPERETIARWWRSVFNTSQNAQLICRTDGTSFQANPAAAQLFKLEPEGNEFSIFKILPATVNQKIERFLRNQSTRPETIPSVTLALDEQTHSWMDLEAVRLDENFMLLTFKDATRRLRLESHMQRLITAIDATPEVFWVTDAGLRITYVNPAFQSATGYGIEEVIGQTDDFLRASSEQEKIKTYLDHVARSREWIGELTNIRRTGEIYQVESTVSPIFDIAGNFMGYVVCERDITARKKLQEDLRGERNLAQSILRSLTGAIYTLDQEFRITHANDGWQHLPREHGGIRFNGAVEMGRVLLDYIPDPPRRAEFQLLFQKVLDSGETEMTSFESADKQHYWVVKISPWRADGKICGLICSVEDQTRNRQLQDQLFQSQKMEIVGSLAASISHDFNNLLQIIIGHANLLEMQAGAGASPLRQGLEKIGAAGLRAREITQQLLAFSRAAAEESVVLDLNKVIKDAEKFARLTLRHNVKLELQPAPEAVAVKMDPTRASQTLLNLFVNSQDAMPDGGTLTVTNAIVALSPETAEKHQCESGKKFARCSVADSGKGIAPNLLPQIFKPFFTTKEGGTGSGLGLPIVQRVAEEAGGFVEVESTLGQGTTFHLYLPLAQEKATAISRQSQATLARGKGLVLVADDVDLLRDFARKFLEMAGFTVLTAESGAAAVQLLEKTEMPVDLVLTDYSMPGMDGVKLVETVSARWPKTKFILTTAYLDEATYARVKNLNATLMLKPYAIHDIVKVIIEKLAVS